MTNMQSSNPKPTDSLRCWEASHLPKHQGYRRLLTGRYFPPARSCERRLTSRLGLDAHLL